LKRLTGKRGLGLLEGGSEKGVWWGIAGICCSPPLCGRLGRPSGGSESSVNYPTRPAEMTCRARRYFQSVLKSHGSIDTQGPGQFAAVNSPSARGSTWKAGSPQAAAAQKAAALPVTADDSDDRDGLKLKSEFPPAGKSWVRTVRSGGEPSPAEDGQEQLVEDTRRHRRARGE
jgi:hypothetical protein